MADQLQRAAAFESRLERVLRAYGDDAVRPVDSLSIAERSRALAGWRHARRTWGWLAAATVAVLLGLLAFAAISGGPAPVLDWLGLVPRPTASATAHEAISQDNLQGTWSRSDRPDTRLVIDGSSATVLDAAGHVQLQESISIGSGVFTLMEGGAVTAECSAQPIIQYVFRVNPSRNGFFALPYAGRGADSCAARAEQFTATWALVSRPERGDLQGTWTRSDPPGTSLVIDGSSARIIDAGGAIVLDETIAIGSGVLTLMEGPAATPACSAHPIIQYAFRVNAAHTSFFMRPGYGTDVDPCSARAEAFTATWTRLSVP